jgi:hypothetical protein
VRRETGREGEEEEKRGNATNRARTGSRDRFNKFPSLRVRRRRLLLPPRSLHLRDEFAQTFAPAAISAFPAEEKLRILLVFPAL